MIMYHIYLLRGAFKTFQFFEKKASLGALIYFWQGKTLCSFVVNLAFREVKEEHLGQKRINMLKLIYNIYRNFYVGHNSV